MTELHEYTALQLHQLLQRREVSPVELTRHYLERIERLDGEVGAFATVTPDAALARARHVEEHVPTAAPLWGMPVADKDLNRRAGTPARRHSARGPSPASSPTSPTTSCRRWTRPVR